MKNPDALDQLLDSLTAEQFRNQSWNRPLADLLSRACSEIGELRADVRALEIAAKSAAPAPSVFAGAAKVIFEDNAKKLAATFKTLAPTEKAPVANSIVFNGPLTAKAAEFSHGLASRSRGLALHIEQVLARANGLDCKNLVVRLQAEADAIKVVSAAFNDFGFSTVNVQRVHVWGGDVYATVVIPAGADGDYCRAVQELTGNKLRCVPA